MPELTTADVAAQAGIHRDTLLRWLRAGRVPEPSRDRNGWRVFTPEEALRIALFARSQSDALEPAHTDEGAQAPELQRLRELDWDFAGAKTSYLTHGLHPYPAKFIPQIPNALIQELSSVGETVGDVFSGSGTTVVEALMLKRHAVGIDANPLACLITRGKTARLTPESEAALSALVTRADGLAARLTMHRDEYSLFGATPFASTAFRPAHDAIEFWFEPFVVEELAEVLSWCRELEDSAARDLALSAFSSIVVAVSRQDSDTRYVRRQKDLRLGDTAGRFARALRDAIRAAVEFSDVVEPRFQAEVVQSSILAAPRVAPLDLVVCSPPYPNAYSYHLYHMTRMIWLGMDQPRFKGEEIGSHRKYSARGKNGATVETFRREMSTVFGWLREQLRHGRYACFVVGDSTIAGERVNNADVLSEAAASHGFTEVSRIERTMQATKKAFNPVIGKIKTEHVLILRNDRRAIA